ncbi:hypothetical protein HNV11_13715 [Spirosoma taeanense]|uniref:Uncharacterized protein n=1 Tax=Spirosoma taeanense TaxID=2735870 RepID=A0A6M5Y7N4_9BACT|nr:hypothetical protein [Spirosoma taeanense]QJW90357.1 hypothetical protein HNV11_13715 [Spirosoma taeanense]
MRPILFSLFLCLSGSVCFAQIDSARTVRSGQTPNPPVLTPGINSPISAPGTLMQSSPRPNALPQGTLGKGDVKTTPPSDPRAFGVAIPLGKAKKDTLKN